MMTECLQCNQDIDLLLIERSSMANRIFASIMYDHNYLNECEWLMYNHLFDYFNSKCNYFLDGIIYLDCPVNIAMDRLKIRDRKGESHVTDKYQTDLQQKHNQWLTNNQIPMLHIGIPYDDTNEMEMETLGNIDGFVQNLKSTNSIQNVLHGDEMQNGNTKQIIHKL